MNEPDRRPRPQYGEYASPEEQKASIQVPAERAHDESVPIARATPIAHENAGHGHPVDGQPGFSQRAPGAPGTGSARLTSAHSGDRIFAIALLALGLLNVVFTVPGLFDLSSTINATFQQMGVGSFTPTPLAHALGIALAVFYIVAWIGTLLLTMPRLRTGRVAFWIPLVAGVVVTLVSMICFLILFLGDPSFVAYMTKNV
ncbi:DUF6264 family protein [Rathayibacter soli]|uniref:DUF6264 family protein n=1 Tax=Rathayibacter soli TaxID=3144168 RepID=UPI0027E40E39|nr:DUF6264 family protein [Glaciibacter superstes]